MINLIKIVLNLIGLIILVPIAVLTDLIYFLTFGLISEKIIAGVVVILLIIGFFKVFGEIFLPESFIRYKDSVKTKIKIKSKANKLIKSNKIINFELDKPMPEPVIFRGTLDERKEFLKEEVERVQKTLDNYNHKYVYENNRFLIKDKYKFVDIKRYSFKGKDEEIAFVNDLLPVNIKHIEPIQDEIRRLTQNLNEDIASIFINYANLLKGLNGEEEVEKYLNLYSNRYKILKNIRIVANGQSSESDIIVICEKGVFIVETKNYGKKEQIIKVSASGKWCITDKNNRYSRELTDVTDQNNYHCAITQTLINEELKKIGYNEGFVDCNSIICIANSEVVIENESKQIVVRPSNIITEIKAFNTNQNLSEEIQEKIYKILLDNNLPEKTFEIDGRANRIETELNRLTELLDINNEFNKTFEVYLDNIYGYVLVQRVF